MNRFIAATVVALGLGAGAAHATDAIYQNYGIVTNEPSINATIFYNQGTFTNFSSTLPFDTQNTLFFTNRGVMEGSCGFRFDTATPTTRHAASVFNNHGLISAVDSGTLFFGVSASGIFGNSGSALASYVLVSATNIINDGTLSVGSVGLLRVTGKNIDLTRGALVAGDLNNDSTNTFNTGTGGVINLGNLNSGRGFLLGNAYVNPVGVVDLYWGANQAGKFDLSQNLQFPFVTSPPENVQFPGGTGARIQLPFTFPADFEAHFFHDPFEPQPNISYRVGTNWYVNVVFVRTNVEDTNVMIEVRTTPSATLNVNFNPLRNGRDDIVQFGVLAEDVITGTTVTNAFYLLDTVDFYDSVVLATNAESPNSIARPVGIEIATATPLEWLFADTNTAPYDPLYLYNPVFSGKIVDYTSGSYGAQVGRNPQNGDGLTSSTNNFFLINAIQTLADPTNQAGRIEITADNLDMTQSRVRAEGLLSINTKHLQGGGSFGVDAGIVNGDIASTNGFLTISNIMPQHFKRVRGNVYCWSGNFDNTETNVFDVQKNRQVTNTVHFHVLVVDHTLKADFTPTIRHLALRATNSVVVQDSMKIVRTSLFDTLNLTLNNTLTFAEAGGAFRSVNIPHLRNILVDTNGALIAEDDIQLGYDTTKGLDTITNLGLINASAVLLKATNIENAGVIIGTNGGSVILQAAGIRLDSLVGDVTLTNGLVGADRDITISTGSLTLAGTAINAGQLGGAGQLMLTATNLLTDNVPGISGTNDVITNFIQVTDGLILNRQPAAGSLYGTQIKTIATGFNEPLHVWAGTDLGPTAAGYAANVVIGRLVLDRQGVHSAFHFTGAGDQSAMYVDFLELDDLSFSDYRNGLIIDPNLTIYFASSTVDPEKLETVYPGRLVWVRDFVGPNSTKVVNRTDGSTCAMNLSLANSTDIDSDQDGTANFYDTDPLDNDADPSKSLPCPGDVSSTALTLSAVSGDTITTLSLASVGPGKVTPNMGVQHLVVGKTYTLTAVPNAGAVFIGWSGATNSTKPAMSFVIHSNTTLRATFIPNPFVPLKGAYNGLFAQSNNVQQASSGFVNLTLTDKGAFSGHFLLAGTTLPFTGQFDLNGAADVTVHRAVKPLALHLQLDVGLATQQVHGTVTDGSWTATLLADLAVVRAAAQPAPQAGSYTLALPGNADAASGPGGNGYGTLTVSRAGLLAVTGKLADGAAFSQSVPVSANGHWPFCVSLLAGKESVLGWMQFADDASDLGGTATWINTPAKRAYYAAGFTNIIPAVGSRYVAPPVHQTGLTLLNPAVTLNGGNLAAPLTTAVVVDTNHLTCASADRSVALTLNTHAGTFTGQLLSPVTGKTVATSGVLLQKQNSASGFFLGTNQSGGLLLQNQ